MTFTEPGVVKGSIPVIGDFLPLTYEVWVKVMFSQPFVILFHTGVCLLRRICPTGGLPSDGGSILQGCLTSKGGVCPLLRGGSAQIPGGLPTYEFRQIPQYGYYGLWSTNRQYASSWNASLELCAKLLDASPVQFYFNVSCSCQAKLPK